VEDFRQAFNNNLRTYEPIGDYLKNRNYTSKPDVLQYLKKKRLENPFKKPTTVLNHSRNQLYTSTTEVGNLLNRSGTMEKATRESHSPDRNDVSLEEELMVSQTPGMSKKLNTSGLMNEDYPLDFATTSPIPKMMYQTRNLARDGGLGLSSTMNPKQMYKTLKDFVSNSPSKGILDNS